MDHWATGRRILIIELPGRLSIDRSFVDAITALFDRERRLLTVSYRAL